jgi:hypothetical protein
MCAQSHRGMFANPVIMSKRSIHSSARGEGHSSRHRGFVPLAAKCKQIVAEPGVVSFSFLCEFCSYVFFRSRLSALLRLTSRGKKT